MKKPAAPGVGEFQFRKGIGEFPGWRGMATEGDPASNAPNQPRLVVNLRLRGGAFVARGGWEDWATFDPRIQHIFDYQLKTPHRLWVIGDGCPGVSASAGFYVGHLDPEQNPEFQPAVYYSGTTTSVVGGIFDGALYLGTDAALRRVNTLTAPWGQSALSLAGTSQDTPLKTFAGFTISFLREFDGKLFIGLDAGAGASKIVTYDGVTYRDDLTAIDAPTCAGLYREQDGGDALVVGFGTSTNNIRYRVAGDSPGSWTTVSPGAGTLGAVEMVPYKDVLYIASANGTVWSYNGTTLQVARTPASATAVRTVTTGNGLLFFGYETAAAALIGKYDGSTWTDAEKNITAQYANSTSIRSLRWYRGSLYAGGVRTSFGGLIWVSPGTTTSGTYLQIRPNTSNNGDVDRLLPF